MVTVRITGTKDAASGRWDGVLPSFSHMGFTYAPRALVGIWGIQGFGLGKCGLSSKKRELCSVEGCNRGLGKAHARLQAGLASPILSSSSLHPKAEHPFCLKEIVQRFQRSRRWPCVGHRPPSLAWSWRIATGKTMLPVCFPGLLSLILSALSGETHVCACLPPHAPLPHIIEYQLASS